MSSNGKDVRATLAMFDLNYGTDPKFRIKFKDQALTRVRSLVAADYSPRGSTPLRDAAMSMIKTLDESFTNAPNSVHIGVLLDESGSMSPNRDAVVQGFNEFVAGVRDVEPDDSGGRVLCVIFTDGYENASTDVSPEQLRQAIHERENSNWTFIYLGANQDAWDEGRQTGFSGGVSGQTVNYSSTPRGTAAAMANITQDTTDFLEDMSSYNQRREESSSRTILESGEEVTTSPPPTKSKVYGDMRDAINKATKR